MYFHSKEITDEIKDRCGRVADGNQLILGKETEEFERRIDRSLFSDFTRQSLLVSNGTVAIELAVRALLQNRPVENYDVLMPVMTVPMIKWAIERGGGNPIAVDVEPDSHCMSPTLAIDMMLKYHAEKQEWPFALLFVYTGAMMPDELTMLTMFCHDHHVQFIEDVSHAYKTMRVRDGLVPGTVGNAVCGSLFATKVLSVGEAGFVRFDNAVAYGLARTIRHQGKNVHDVTIMNGYNFRASEYTAAVGNVKLKHLASEIAYRQSVVNEVYLSFVNEHDICVPHWRQGISQSYYKFVLQYPDARRDETIMRATGCPVSGAVHHGLAFPQYAMMQFPGAAHVDANHICAPVSSVADARRFCQEWEQIHSGAHS